jgi:hypothetical protein
MVGPASRRSERQDRRDAGLTCPMKMDDPREPTAPRGCPPGSSKTLSVPLSSLFGPPTWLRRADPRIGWPNHCGGEPPDKHDDFLGGACRSSESIEGLKTGQRVQDINGFFDRLLAEAAKDGTQPSPSPLITVPHGLFEIRIERRQGPDTADHETIGSPETGEGCNQSGEGVAWIGRSQRAAEPLDETAGRQVVEQRFEESTLRGDGQDESVTPAGLWYAYRDPLFDL